MLREGRRHIRRDKGVLGKEEYAKWCEIIYRIIADPIFTNILLAINLYIPPIITPNHYPLESKTIFFPKNLKRNQESNSVKIA